MARIDSTMGIQHAGDNRHSPLRIVDAKLHPYHARPQENRDIENRIAPRRRRMSKAAAEQQVKTLVARVKKDG